MRIINTSVCAFQNKVLVIGFEGENERTQVRIDASEVFTEYPNAAPSLTVKPNSGEAYPVLVNRDGTDVVWDITSSYLTERGESEIQLTFIKDSVVCKSYIGKALVLRSLTVEGEMPTPVESWVDAANAKLAEVDAQIVELEGMVDTATDAATRAEQSASTASTKAEQAAGSAATATEKATEATNAAGTATAKAAEAALSATQANNSAVSAADSERIATAKAGEATTAAGTATAKAEQATEAAQTATEKAGDASASARAAHASEISAAESADDALAAKTAAEAAKRAAEASATQAAQSAQGASADAQTATQKAAEATQSATDAATFAGTATTKAEEAAASAQAASDAKTAVEQTAEQLADSLEQIEQNTQDIAELDERKANIDGYYQDMTVGDAEQLISSKYVENSEPYTLRTSGGSSDIGNREYLDAVVGGTLAWNQMVRDEASTNETDFAPIVTVTDAVEDAAGVKVKIEPVQDLQGYDHPWPAGGGANKMPALVPGEYTNDGIKAVVDGNGVVTVTGQKNVSSGTTVILPLEEAFTPVVGQYFHLRNSQAMSKVAISRIAGSPTLAPVNRIVQLTAAQTEVTSLGIYVTADVTDALNFTLQMSIEDSGDVTDWTPYSNICPITGWDGVNVTRTGANVWDEEWEQGNYDGNTGQKSASSQKVRNKNLIPVLPNTQYYAVIPTPPTKLNAYWYDANGDFISSNTGAGIGGVFTTPDNCYFMAFSTFGTAYSTYAQNISINYPSTDTAYHVYTGATFPISFPSEAGTVYGGELTVNADGSGSLVVDSINYDVSNDTAWGIASTTLGGAYFYKRLLDTAILPLNITQELALSKINEKYSCGRIENPYDHAESCAWAYRATDGGYLRIGFPAEMGIDTVEKFNEWRANNIVQIYYPLLNAITYILTASEIRTLLGTNNVWSDAGQTALTYTGTDEHLTLESGKKYLSRISGTDSMLLGSGQEITAAKGTDNVFDLTQMFGTAVADYVYGQGAAFFRKWFPNAVYPYNAGELKHVEGLQSHDMVGFNLVDLSEFAKLYPSACSMSGSELNCYSIAELFNTGISVRLPYDVTSGYISVELKTTTATNVRLRLAFSDGIYQDLGGTNSTTYVKYGRVFNRTARLIAIRLNWSVAGSLSVRNLCLNIAHNGSRNGEYEPYEKHSYPLDSSVILRGIPKVGANGVYWDGDRYLPDGTVERRYVAKVLTGADNENWRVYATSSLCNRFALLLTDRIPTANSQVVDTSFMVYGMTTIPKSQTGSVASIGKVSGWDTGGTGLIFSIDPSVSLEQFKASLAENPLYLVYELATPTTETAQPYHSTQWVSDWGTEEFVSTGIVPVGSETRYPANLRDKLQHLPDAASGNGSYLITQTDGQMVLTPFPAPPSTAGNYVLKATVTGGVATYTWEAAT